MNERKTRFFNDSNRLLKHASLVIGIIIRINIYDMNESKTVSLMKVTFLKHSTHWDHN